MTKYRSITTYILALLFLLTPPISSSTQNNRFVDYVLSEQRKNCMADRLCNYNGTETFRKGCRACFECQCDDDCKQYGDCCPDISPSLLAEPNTAATKSQYYCQSENFKQVKLYRSGKYFFSVAKCSSFTDPLSVSLCHSPNWTDPYTSRPVTSSASGEVYRNEFCAKCNEETKYKLWNFRLNCKIPITVPPEISADQILDYFVQHPKCSLSYSAPDSTQTRPCYIDSAILISSCNQTGLWLEQNDVIQRACGTYYNPVLVESKGFKNLFCFYCNSAYISKPVRLCAFDIPYPFSVLMDPDAANKIITKTRQSCQCKDNEVYDRFKKICRPMMCSFGRKLEEKKCVSRYIQAKNLPYSFEVTLTPANISIGSDANVWMATLISNIQTAFETKTKGYDTKVHRVGLRSILKINNTRVLKLLFLVKFVLVSEVNLDVFENLLTDLRHSYWIIPYEGSFVNMTSAGSLTLSNSEINYDKIYFNSTVDYYSWTYAKRILHGWRYFNAEEPLNYMTVTETLICPLVQLELNETTDYSRANQTLLLLVTNSTLNSDQFFTAADGTVSICQDIVTGTRKCALLSPEDIFSKEYIIVSTTCQAVSLVSLLTTFIVFCLFPSLRTLPGKTTMGLILTLFFAVGLNLFGISRVEDAIVCKVIAILIHFFLMSSFTWMGICSFHMYRVFKNITMSKKSTSSERKVFAIYVMISVLIPLAINAVVIGTNYARNGPSDIGYGINLCYVSNFYSIIFGVLIPLAIVVLFNFVLLILTVVSLRKMSIEHSKMTGKKENVYMYVKLSSLTGLNWMFAFLAPLTGNQVLWYVFAVLCGLQGVYIFLAFVCNRRVLTLFKEKCQGIEKGSVGSKRNTTTTGSGSATSSALTKNNSETRDKTYVESTSSDF